MGSALGIKSNFLFSWFDNFTAISDKRPKWVSFVGEEGAVYQQR